MIAIAQRPCEAAPLIQRISGGRIPIRMKAHFSNSTVLTYGLPGSSIPSFSKHARMKLSKRLISRAAEAFTRHLSASVGRASSTCQAPPTDNRSINTNPSAIWNAGGSKRFGVTQCHSFPANTSLRTAIGNSCRECIVTRTTTCCWPETSFVLLTTVTSSGSRSGLETSTRTTPPRSKRARIHHRNRFIDSSRYTLYASRSISACSAVNPILVHQLSTIIHQPLICSPSIFRTRSIT
jgi:hypothetical protein